MKAEELLKVAVVVLAIVLFILLAIPVITMKNETSSEIDTDMVIEIYRNLVEINDKREELLNEFMQKPATDKELLEKMRNLETKYLSLLMYIGNLTVREYEYKYPGNGYISIKELLKETPEPLVELEYEDTYKGDCEYEEGVILLSENMRIMWSTNVKIEGSYSYEIQSARKNAVIVVKDSRGCSMIIVDAKK